MNQFVTLGRADSLRTADENRHLPPTLRRDTIEMSNVPTGETVVDFVIFSGSIREKIIRELAYDCARDRLLIFV